ncbi:MAG: TetR family transcriptional regulator C-terminal domain-containing protein [Oleiphilaceae bacterium]|nr:TetR family transcriptional regulator C-terminal domain-containing protein [Oleiphilaceae bacterium]
MPVPATQNPVKASLLNAGRELLSQQGYHGTGIKAVLDRVGVPKGSFYHYFPSKEAFTAAIIRDYSDWLLGLMDMALARQGTSPRERIRQLYRQMIAEFERHDCVQGCLLGNLAAEIGAASPDCRQALNDAYNRWQNRFTELVAEGQAQDQFRQDLSPESISILFWNHWEGAILRMKLLGNSDSLHQTLDQLLDRLLAPSNSQ